LTTVTLSVITFQTVNLNNSNRFKTLLLVLLLRLLNPLISLPFSKLSTGYKDQRTHRIINFSLSLTKFLQLLNLAIFTTLSLFNLLAVPTLHLLSLSLAHQPSPWKSQIAHLDMHHLVFGINFQIHSVSLTILVLIHLLIHFSNSSLSSSPLSSSITPSLFHSTLKTYLFNKSFPP